MEHHSAPAVPGVQFLEFSEWPRTFPSYTLSTFLLKFNVIGAYLLATSPSKYQTNTHLQRNDIDHVEHVLKRYEKSALEEESGFDDLSAYVANSAASLLARILQENKKQQGTRGEMSIELAGWILKVALFTGDTAS